MAGNDFNQIMGAHGEKVAIVLGSLGVLAFAVMMITGASPEIAPKDFESRVGTIANRLDVALPPGEGRADVPDYRSAVGSTISGTADYGDSSLSRDMTQVPVEVTIEAPFTEATPPPPSDLKVVKAKFGEVSVEFVPTRNKACQSYLLKIWPDGDSEPDDGARPRGDDTQIHSVPNRSGDEVMIFTFKDLTDNTKYWVQVRCVDNRNNRIKFEGATPDNDDHMRIEATPLGEERFLPAPTGCRVVDASLAGVIVEWDDIRDKWEDEGTDGFPHPALAKTYVRFYRWFGNNRRNMELILGKPDNDHPQGYTLEAFYEEFGTRYNDLAIAPEVDIHYGLQLYHLEAYPHDDGKAHVGPGDRSKVIGDKSYRGEIIEVNIGEINPNTGEPANVRQGQDPTFEDYEVFGSEFVEFEGHVNLPNRAVFEVAKASAGFGDAWRNPDGDNVSARINVTRYFEVNGRWERLTAEFTVDMTNKMLGAKAVPDTQGAGTRFRDWADKTDGVDKNTEFDFTTPYELTGVYKLESPDGDDVVYVELQDTTAKRTWPIRIFEEGDAGQRKGNGSGLTPVRRLAAWREFQDLDRGDESAVWDFCAKWGMRQYTSQQITIESKLSRWPYSQLDRLAKEGKFLEEVAKEWETLAKSYEPGVGRNARRAVRERQSFCNREFGDREFALYGDVYAIPSLLEIIRTYGERDDADQAKADAIQAWEAIIAFSTSIRARDIGMSIPDNLKLPGGEVDEKLAFISDRYSDLFNAIERHYRE